MDKQEAYNILEDEVQTNISLSKEVRSAIAIAMHSLYREINEERIKKSK